jgi:hypothetical protein
MKAHIIQLDQHDNVLSISDKMSWGKAKRVLLVYPPSGELILRKIDLLLIQRAAQKMGFTISLVSIPKDIQKLANDLNIPFFRSINDAQRMKWKARSKKNIPYDPKPFYGLQKVHLDRKPKGSDWQSQVGARFIIFSIGVLAVILIALLFIPSAVIHLNLSEQRQSISFQVDANESVNDVNFTGSIPSDKISVEMEGTKQTNVFSQVEVPDKNAYGLIRFTNLSDEMVLIPAGTIVAQLNNPGIRFYTTVTGEVLAGSGNTIDVPIQALTAGKIGNLEVNSIGSLIGDLGIKLTVTNPEPTIGGTNLVTTKATETDRENLFNSLEAELRNQAIQKIRSSLVEGDIIFTDTILLEKTVEEVYVPTDDQPGEQLSLKLKLIYSIRYAEYSDLLKLAFPTLRSNLPSDYTEVNNSMVIEPLGQPETNSTGTTIIEMEFTQRIKRIIDLISLSRLVQGVKLKEAYNLLHGKYENEMNPIIEIDPSWWPRLPIVPLRIVVLD